MGSSTRNSPKFAGILFFFAVVFCMFWLSGYAKAQAPDLSSYQLIARDPSGIPYVNQNITVRMVILNSGTSVYREDHYMTTDEIGLVSISIGNGVNKNGDFGSINWGDGNYSLRIRMDPAGGTSFTTVGTFPMTSVPYALFAGATDNADGSATRINAGSMMTVSGTGTIPDPYLISSSVDGSETRLSEGSSINISGSGTAGSPYIVSSTIVETDPAFSASASFGIEESDTSNWNNKQDALVAGSGITIAENTISAEVKKINNPFYVGQDILGGIVFYTYWDENGDQAALLISKVRLSQRWQVPTSLVGANRSADGQYNYNLMVNSPAKDYITENFSEEWYLGSPDEFKLLWMNRWLVNQTLRSLGGTLVGVTDVYWTSLEDGSSNAFELGIIQGTITSRPKNNSLPVRPMRRLGGVADVEGNLYPVIRHCNQEWMAVNLRTTTYSDGTSIDLIDDASTWSGLTTGAYCWYDNDSITNSDYGPLYNWHAVNTGKLCPEGWHVPTAAEWTELENCLIDNGYNYDGTFVDNKIGKSMATSSGWTSSGAAGAVGNTDYSSFRNKSGFSALPAGRRVNTGVFDRVLTYGHFWTSTESTATSANLRFLFNTQVLLNSTTMNKRAGLSVRCVKD